ncbi:hypothetical protein OBBRIDRAFT_102562 [Obba rivulosa]|uniref:Uncharacterized protein n=1 Tax=Obba rivulosa TaxID=1052685 RepID=A0A8E2J4U8_9APHY|nr:hypothetical protein OBBRIDRAFT_102562 [Obba rivulosa]
MAYRDLQQESDIDEDIRLHIEAEFQRYANGARILLNARPDAVTGLVSLADGLFIYASTVVRFLVRDKHYAVEIYDKLLQSQGSKGSHQLYERLDTLYTTILDNAFGMFKIDRKRLKYIHQVLTWFALNLDAPLSGEDLQFIGIPIHITMDVIDRLRSVFIVEYIVTTTTCMVPCHASFPQFLIDGERCQDSAYLVNSRSGNAMIAASLFKLLTSNTLPKGADGDLPHIWKSADGKWMFHVLRAKYTYELAYLLRIFVESHLEAWLRGVEPWQHHGHISKLHVVSTLAATQDWCKRHRLGDDLVARLGQIVDQNV